ncbi:MAG: integral rane sensor hybrid histidine kinase [Rhizorhabdus sp.]|nr:integral rane sensor hybrid histidine kinase [Rhizorhabdus sp.]
MTQRHRRLADWPLIAKFGITPALSLLALFLFTAMGVAALHRARDATLEIVQSDLGDASRLAQIDHEFERADGNLFRLLTAKAANPKSTDVVSRAAAIQREFAEVRRGLKVLRATGIGRPNHARIDMAIDQLDDYAQAVEVMTAMLDVNFDTAVSMLPPFQKHAAIVSSTLRNVGESAVAQSTRRAQIVSDNVEEAKIELIWLAVLAVIAIAVAAFTIGIATIRSILKIADATTRLAKADYEIDISALRRGDELGAVVTALETFRSHALDTARLLREREDLRREAEDNDRRRAREIQIAEHDNRERAASERRLMLDALARAFEDRISTIIAAVSRSSASLLANAEQLTTYAEQTRRESTLLDRESRDMAESMQIAASATDELMMSFAEIGRHVDDSHHVATSACRETEKARDTVALLAQEADRIETVVVTINQIASRTKLLALNATIEAARAGEAGRGFAVVAMEVKGLAGQTSDATNRVRGQISGIQASANGVVDATGIIATMVQHLNDVGSMVTGAVEQQLLAGAEIAGVVAAAVNKTEDLVSASRHIRRSVEQNSNAANDVRAAVDELELHFLQLRSDAEKFVGHIRAA